eukprot:jgi/Tetstr1/435536/TSEL_024440.t1
MATSSSGGGSFLQLPVRLRARCALLRYLAVKRHSPAVGAGGGASAAQHARTAFVAGLPHALTREEALLQLFQTFGAVATVAIHHKQTSAMVVFREEASLSALLTAAANGNVLQFVPPDPEAPYGLKGWVEAHKAEYPGTEALLKQIDAYWQRHTQEQERLRAARDAAMTDDGWTVVSRHKGRKKNRDSGGTVVAGAAAAIAAEAADKPTRTLDDFYRFQSREKRRDALLELRKKFQQDKKRIAELRAQRRFRPY